MTVISLKQIQDFGRKYVDSRDALYSWYYEVCNADWNTSQDIKARYPSASFLGNNVVIFNIRGNKYRLVTKVSYQNKIVFIKWIGTHAEYDKKDFNN